MALQPGQKPPTAAELEEAGYALLEQLAERDALRQYKPLLQAVAPALRGVGAELARQSEGKTASPAERKAIAARAGDAVYAAMLDALGLSAEGKAE